MAKKISKQIEHEIQECPLQFAINVIGGKWKTIIIYILSSGTMRFGEIRKALPKITQKMLTQQLRELESDGLVNRVIYAEIPPKVEYSLTKLGKDLCPILNKLCTWGAKLENK